MFIKFISSFLFISLISSSVASLIDRITDDIQEVSSVQEDDNANNRNIWVVLVAGSKGYYNYRHQSDVLHAYHLIHNLNNVPKEHIILMMYDDIAYAEENPVKGNIINYPDGENLYTDDIEKDYVGEDVTPENFLGVLLKDQKLIDRNKKVLNSTSDDSVFIYFTDHGAPSLVAFPNGILSATKLNKTLHAMKEQRSFGKMVIYIEACESGSMFIDDLNPANNIYAVTASSFNEPSYAAFWDEKRRTYLADEFSITWITDSYAVDIENNEETLFSQYEHVKNKTLDSHVCDFGDIKMANRYDTSDFQGKSNIKKNNSTGNIKSLLRNLPPRDVIRSDEVEFHLTRIHSELNNDDSFERLVRGRRLMGDLMNSLGAKIAETIGVKKSDLLKKEKSNDLVCYEQLIDHFTENCVQLHVHTYLLRHLYLFVNTCNIIKRQNTMINVNDLKAIITEQCSSKRDAFTSLTKVV